MGDGWATGLAGLVGYVRVRHDVAVWGRGRRSYSVHIVLSVDEMVRVRGNELRGVNLLSKAPTCMYPL